MKLENYEIITDSVTPAYTYIEGEEKEQYWTDVQNMWYNFFCVEDPDNENNKIETRKYWVILPYKPKGTKITSENADKLIKWLVASSWHTDASNPEHDDIDYIQYEWEFRNHIPKCDQINEIVRYINHHIIEDIKKL